MSIKYADKIRLLMAVRRISHRGLSRAAGVSEESAGRWARGETHPRKPETVKKIAEALDVRFEAVDPREQTLVAPFVLIPGSDGECVAIRENGSTWVLENDAGGREVLKRLEADEPQTPALQPTVAKFIAEAGLEGAVCIEAPADAPAPIERGDVLVIDPSVRSIREAGVYRLYISNADLTVVRRIVIRTTGPVIVDADGHEEGIGTATVTGRVKRILRSIPV